MGKILAYIQCANGDPTRNALEAFRAAQLLAADLEYQLSGTVFGAHLPDSVKALKMDQLIHVQSPSLMSYTPELFVAAMDAVMKTESPDIMIAGHTYQVRDWLPRLAGQRNCPMVSDCIGYHIDPELIWVRQVFQGKINADVVTSAEQVIVSFQSGAYRADQLENGNPSIRAMEVDLSQVTLHVRPGEKFQDTKDSIDLSHAERIISVGRGISEEAKLSIIHELAAVLDAELASSRPVVDYGWLEHDRQVGSSGQTVSPKLYLAVGLSGAIQHQVGMKNSGCIVAINKDAHAPIFEIADYGVVADLFEIIPQLTTALAERQKA